MLLNRSGGKSILKKNIQCDESPSTGQVKPSIYFYQCYYRHCFLLVSVPSFVLNFDIQEADLSQIKVCGTYATLPVLCKLNFFILYCSQIRTDFQLGIFHFRSRNQLPELPVTFESWLWLQSHLLRLSFLLRERQELRTPSRHELRLLTVKYWLPSLLIYR